MSKFNKLITALALPYAGYLNASEPMVWATASPQPAFVASDQAAARLAPSGFDQAQGE